LEMYDGGDRLAVDHGASGAPVLDCEGRVAAVVSHVITQTLTMVSREIRVSTAWGTPNVVSVPIQVLDESFPAQGACRKSRKRNRRAAKRHDVADFRRGFHLPESACDAGGPGARSSIAATVVVASSIRHCW